IDDAAQRVVVDAAVAVVVLRVAHLGGRRDAACARAPVAELGGALTGLHAVDARADMTAAGRTVEAGLHRAGGARTAFGGLAAAVAGEVRRRSARERPEEHGQEEVTLPHPPTVLRLAGARGGEAERARLGIERGGVVGIGRAIVVGVAVPDGEVVARGSVAVV